MTRNVAPFALTLALLAGAGQSQESLTPPVEAADTQPERDERAITLLTRARDAMKENTTISLSIRSEIKAESGPLQAFKLGAEGNAWLRTDESGRWTRAMVGNADDIGSEEQISFTVIKSDGNASWIDHEQQEVVHATGRYAKGKVYGSADLFGLDYLLASTPYARELSAGSLEVVGTAPVDNVLCDIIRVVYNGRALPMRWYISSSDGFPRMIVEELMEGAERVYEFSDVEFNATIEDARFTIEVPSTYIEKNLPNIAATPADQAAPIANPLTTDTVPEDTKLFGFEVGKLGAPFTASDIFGEEYELKDYRGKPVVLFFWASWVPSTSLTAGEIIQINDYLGDDGKLLSIAMRERQPEAAVNLMLEEDRDDIVVITTGNRTASLYNIAKIPVVIVLDAEGMIVYRNEEYKLEDSINEVKAAIDGLRK